MIYTKWQLFGNLARPEGYTSSQPTLTFPNGRKGWVDSIQREDGSGHKWNVSVKWADGTHSTIFVQTTD